MNEALYKFNSVVVIDDDNVTHLLCNYMMKKAAFAKDIHNFSYGDDALKFLRETAEKNPQSFPDVLFLDINMPLMSGWEFMKQYSLLPKEVIAKCKLFMLSTSLDPADRDLAFENNLIVAFIEKPISIKLLEEITNQKA